MKSILFFVCGLLSILPLTAQQSSPPPSVNKVVIIPVRDQIAPPELFILRRGLKTAIEQGAETVILDMNTPGGRLDVTFDMLKAIEKFPGKVITYINDEAISAGALISAGTAEIYFSPSAIIGAAAPVTGAGVDIDATMKQKIVSALKARVRSLAGPETNRSKAISAMIDADYELKIGDEIIKPKGELLTLTATEACKTYGDPPTPLLAAGIEPSLDALTDRLFGKGNYTTIPLRVTWSEKIAQYLTTFSPFLLAIGLVLIFIEFKTPGFGIFGISGALIVGVVFFGHHAAGLSGHEPALFFFIGFALVIIDLFLIPGFFILAIPGALIMLASLIWGMSDIWPDQPIKLSSEIFFRPLVNLITGLTGAIVILIAIFRFLPSGGLWGKMVLNSAVGGETTLASAARSEPALIGSQGYAFTALFPSGQIEINGKRYDARLALGDAQPGTPVRVTGKSEFELIVEAI